MSCYRPPVYERYDIYLADSESETSAPIGATNQHDDLTAGHNDLANNDTYEDDTMEDEVDATGNYHDEDEVYDYVSEQEEFDEDTMEEDIADQEDVDVAEEEDVDISDEDTMEDDADIDVSDAETPSDQDAHDSGVDASRQVDFEGYMLTETPLKTIKKTISKEDKELHHKAGKLQPHHLPAHRYWMAILMHTVQPSKAKVEKDFVWLKGSRVSATTVSLLNSMLTWR